MVVYVTTLSEDEYNISILDEGNLLLFFKNGKLKASFVSGKFVDYVDITESTKQIAESIGIEIMVNVTKHSV